jgi:hypothetical protein
MEHGIANAVGMIIGGVIGGCIGSLVGAVFLKLAARWIVKKRVSFGSAYITSLIAFFLSYGAGFVIGFAAAAAGGESLQMLAQLAMLPAGFLIQSGVVARRLRVSYPWAMLVTLVSTIMGFALLLLIALALVLNGVELLPSPK